VIDAIDISYYISPMSMGKRKRERQPGMWVATTDWPTAASHPFYRCLNRLLREHGLDDSVTPGALVSTPRRWAAGERTG
jgi:hypothetical protein